MLPLLHLVRGSPLVTLRHDSLLTLGALSLRFLDWSLAVRGKRPSRFLLSSRFPQEVLRGGLVRRCT